MVDRDTNLTLAIGEPSQPGGPRTIILGMPKGAWDKMEGGLTNTVDLTSLGIPFTVVLFRGLDGADVLAQFRSVGAVDCGMDRDLGVKEQPK